MNIQEAVKQSLEKGVAITRDNDRMAGAILPTNINLYQCLIITTHYERKQTAHARWQPSADDLMADDWILYP